MRFVLGASMQAPLVFSRIYIWPAPPAACVTAHWGKVTAGSAASSGASLSVTGQRGIFRFGEVDPPQFGEFGDYDYFRISQEFLLPPVSGDIGSTGSEDDNEEEGVEERRRGGGGGRSRIWEEGR